MIDSDREMRLCVEMILAPQGYQVVSCASWAEGRNVLQQDHFDLVLSDLQPGNGRGETTIKTIHELGNSTEEMVCLPFDNIQEGRAALCHGAAGYLLQPYDSAELLAMVDRSIFRSEESASHSNLYRENSELRASREVLLNCLCFLQVDDLDRLGDLVLDRLMELCAAEAGILWLSSATQSELHLQSLRGLAQIGSRRCDVLDDVPSSAEEGRTAPWLSTDAHTLHVPLHSGGRMIGLVRLESPLGRGVFLDDECRSAASAAIFASAALSALLRRQEIEHNLLRAPGSQAYNMTFFRDHLEKDLYAATRYGRKLALLKVVIDNYDELSSRFHDRQVNESVEKMVETIMTVLRDADLICTLLPGQFYILLPETDPWGALMAQRRIRKALQGQLIISDIKKNLPIRVQMRSATAPLDGTTLLELDHLLESRLAMLRNSLLLRSNLENVSFWKVVDALLSPDGARLLRQQGEAGAAFITFEAGQLELFALSVCREILSAVSVSGVILWGSDELSHARSTLGPLLTSHDTRTALYLLGGGKEAEGSDLPAGVTIPLEDEALRDKAFLLCLGEDYAYALLARRDQAGWHAFHTNDCYFVENLLAKLQEQYQLQAQI